MGSKAFPPHIVYLFIAILGLACATSRDRKSALPNQIHKDSSRAIAANLGGKYLVPDVFKDVPAVGDILDVKSRDFTRVMSAEFCLGHMKVNGILPNFSTGSASVATSNYFKDLSFNLGRSQFARNLLPELKLDATDYQRLDVEIRALSYASFPIGEAELSRACQERLDAKYLDPATGELQQGLIMVAEALYAEAVEVTVLDGRGSSFNANWLSKQILLTPGMRLEVLNEETLRIEGKRLIAIAPGTLFYRPASPDEPGILMNPHHTDRGHEETTTSPKSTIPPLQRTHRIDVKLGLPPEGSSGTPRTASPEEFDSSNSKQNLDVPRPKWRLFQDTPQRKKGDSHVF